MAEEERVKFVEEFMQFKIPESQCVFADLEFLSEGKHKTTYNCEWALLSIETLEGFWHGVSQM